MKTKIIEVRDIATFIVLVCVDMNPETFPAITRRVQDWYLRRAGYPCDGRPNILITRVDGRGKASNDPYSWGDRTLAIAHQHIIEKWDSLHDGDVVDVQFILKETAAPKTSERLSNVSVTAQFGSV